MNKFFAALLVGCLLGAVLCEPALGQRGSLRSQLAQLPVDTDETHTRIELIRRILLEDPDDEALKMDLLRLWFAVDDFDMAEAHLKYWPEAPEDLRVMSQARILWEGDGEKEQAVEMLGAFLEANPAHTGASLQLVEYLRETGELARLRDFLEQSPLPPGHQELGVRLAEARRDTGAYAEALEAFEAARELAPQDRIIQQNAPKFERLKKILPQLRIATSALEKNPEDFSALCRRAHYALLGEVARQLVMVDAETALSLTEEATLPRLHLAMASGLDDREAEEKFFAKKSQGLPSDTDLDLWISLDAQVNQALKTLDEEDPESVRGETALRLARAHFLNNRKQPRLARRDAEQALENVGESFPEALLELLRAQSALSGIQSAEAALHGLKNHAETTSDHLFVAHQALGAALLENHRFGDALAQYSAALALRETAEVLRQRALIHKRLNQPEDAEADLARADELD